MLLHYLKHSKEVNITKIFISFGVTGSMMVSAHIHQEKLSWRFATLNNL